MLNKKSTLYINIILYIIYICSIGFFAYTKSFGNIGLSLSCLIGTFILSIFNKKYLSQLNDRLYITLVLFIMFSSLLGSCYRFYDIINHYDDFLHIWSGFISVSVAYSLLISFNKSDIVNNINKYFIAIYICICYCCGWIMGDYRVFYGCITWSTHTSRRTKRYNDRYDRWVIRCNNNDSIYYEKNKKDVEISTSFYFNIQS